MNKNEQRMHDLLKTIWPEEQIRSQVPLLGKSIDFVVPGPLLIEANGHWWHGLEKIKPCDVKKLTQLFEDQWIVCGVWDWRLESQPDLVAEMLVKACKESVITVWDWHVQPTELSPRAQSFVNRKWAVGTFDETRLTPWQR